MGRAWVAWGLVLGLLPFGVQAEEQWEIIETDPVVIRVRSRPGTAVREVWAETDLDASVKDLQDVILDAESYPRFMPYLKETRWLDPPSVQAGRKVYTLLSFPFLGLRDYVVKVFVDRKVAADGSGFFANHWVSDPGAVPVRDQVVRLKVNEGSWQVFPYQGKTHVIYRFAVDPGSWVPPFVADIGNRSGVIRTLRAVEHEAQKRHGEARKVSRVP